MNNVVDENGNLIIHLRAKKMDSGFHMSACNRIMPNVVASRDPLVVTCAYCLLMTAEEDDLDVDRLFNNQIY